MEICMRKDDCLFCKIAHGEIPSVTLYEDDMFRVILDISPASKGHALILPKDHFDNLYELDDEYASKVMVLAKKMARAMTKALHADGFNLLQNNGEVAGQTIFHFHLHLIPRYDDGSELLFWEPKEFSEEDRLAIEREVKACLEA